MSRKPKKLCFALIFICVFSFIIIALWMYFSYEYQKPKILKFAERGKWERVEEILLKEEKEEVSEKYGLVLLFKACLQERKDAVGMLIKKGVDVNEKNAVEYTPLMVSVNARKKDVVEVLLDNGAKPDIIDPYGRTTLHTAVILGPVEIVKELLEHGADVNNEGPDGWSPLHRAIRSRTPNYAKKEYDRISIVKTLIEYGVDVNARNKKGKLWDIRHDSSPLGRRPPPEGETPLEIASNLGYENIVELLKKHGAR